MRVVCLGDLMVDVLAQLPGPLAAGSDTPAPITVLGGGSAANTAAWLAAAGTPATFVGRVGDDVLGRLALDELTAQGIDLAVSVDPLRPTGTCIVLVDRDGERTMVPNAGANAALADVPFDPALLAPDVHLHVSAYALFQPGARPAVEAALGAATDRRLPISLDAASVAPLATFGVAAFLDWLPRCLLFANRDEATLLAGVDDIETATRLLARRCGEAIVKCGAEGALWSAGEQVIARRPPRVAVVDSTGAGDAFAAGVLTARFGGAVPGAQLEAGMALAARVIAVPGGRPRQDLS